MILCHFLSLFLIFFFNHRYLLMVEWSRIHWLNPLQSGKSPPSNQLHPVASLSGKSLKSSFFFYYFKVPASLPLSLSLSLSLSSYLSISVLSYRRNLDYADCISCKGVIPTKKIKSVVLSMTQKYTRNKSPVLEF